MNNVTRITPRPQRPRYLTPPVTVGQYQALMAAIEAIPARTAAEFKRQGLVPPADLPPMPAPQWADDSDPF